MGRRRRTCPSQWVLANLRLAQASHDSSDARTAVKYLEAALERPQNLGEGKHPLTPENEIQYHLGLALLTTGRRTDAQNWLTLAATPQGDPRAPLGEPAYWRARALQALGDDRSAAGLLEQLLLSARQSAEQTQAIDYFATSLPTFLVFADDLGRRNQVDSHYLEALALSGLGHLDAAVANFRTVLNLDPLTQVRVWHLRALDSDSAGANGLS